MDEKIFWDVLPASLYLSSCGQRIFTTFIVNSILGPIIIMNDLLSAVFQLRLTSNESKIKLMCEELV